MRSLVRLIPLGALLFWGAAACHRSTPAQPALACAIDGALPIDTMARAELVRAREAVWRAYFAGDSARLSELLPDPMIGMGKSRRQIIAEAQEFVESGGRLVGLEFTCDEFFLSGDVAVVFSAYRVDLEVRGEPSTDIGRAIELFERRDGSWVNPSWHLDHGQ